LALLLVKLAHISDTLKGHFSSSSIIESLVLFDIVSKNRLYDLHFMNYNSYVVYKGLVFLNAIEQAREIIAKRINAQTDEIIFLSGGSESDNLGIKGLA